MLSDIHYLGLELDFGKIIQKFDDIAVLPLVQHQLEPAIRSFANSFKAKNTREASRGHGNDGRNNR